VVNLLTASTDYNCGMASISRCRIVLVRTHYPGNLGATARVMRNFGFTELVLVDPIASTGDLEARRMATHGLGVLDAARIVPEVADAVGDCAFTLATSGLANGVVRQTFVGSPRDKFPALLKAAESAPVALVFGPEPHGLSNAEITRCHGLVHIPVDPAAPALNLAQAVAICCHELYGLAKESGENGTGPAIAPFADQERMFDHLKDAFEAVGYLHGTKADPLMHAVRHLIGRAMPTPQEVKLLHGLARQMLWMSEQAKK
jgi:tRNA/rRNA methyltransferase